MKPEECELYKERGRHCYFVCRNTEIDWRENMPKGRPKSKPKTEESEAE